VIERWKTPWSNDNDKSGVHRLSKAQKKKKKYRSCPDGALSAFTRVTTNKEGKNT
jgi:hypothetical protein